MIGDVDEIGAMDRATVSVCYTEESSAINIMQQPMLQLPRNSHVQSAAVRLDTVPGILYVMLHLVLELNDFAASSYSSG